METAPVDDSLSTLTDLCRHCAETDELLNAALPHLLVAFDADAGAVLRRSGDDVILAARAGADLDISSVTLPDIRSTAPDPEPPVWQAVGERFAATHRLPGGAGILVLGRRRPVAASPAHDTGDVALALLDSALMRIHVQDELTDLLARVDSAQQLANMGDYDWHIATDTNRWSDQLYRIYGHEPQTFNASYERFLSQIHPDDRDVITKIHQQAYATGEPYEMVERIVRPDGSIRYLASNGEVIMDAAGQPKRMRGTCVDITERVLAEQAREHTAALAASLHEVQLRRRQALEMNDNVVQGLTAASLSLNRGDSMMATAYIDHTLHAARRMMNDWLDPLDGDDLKPGDLVRETASVIGVGEPTVIPPSVSEVEPSRRRRILIVDDNVTIRALFRAQLAAASDYVVVGEAGDGEAAVEAAAALKPDVVLLDLAMPRMDGLQALPLIREAVPDAHVIVLSGFDERSMAAQVLAAGAARYIEKGPEVNLIEVIDGVVNSPIS